MPRRTIWLLGVTALIPGLLLIGCIPEPEEVQSNEPPRHTVTYGQSLGAGFRFSTYGPDYAPGPAYWADVGT